VAEKFDDTVESRALESEPADMERLERAFGQLQARVSDLERNLESARREASKAQWSVRLLRNAGARLLAPIVLVGSAGFLSAWIEADRWWDYALIGAAGVIGILWVRDVGRNFDDVIKGP
jgi:hypothetical protein